MLPEPGAAILGAGYLADRRLDTLTAGYAPSGDRLIRHLHQLGYTDGELLAAGLARTGAAAAGSPAASTTG